MRILLVEDHVTFAEALREALQREGFVVNHVTQVHHAELTLATDAPDLMILDLGLPDQDGLVFLKRLRQAGRRLPILILTARDRLDDKVTGLDEGADDYLAKPFDMPELLARLRVLERRLSTQSHALLTVGSLALDTRTQSVTQAGQTLTLSRREYGLLKALMENVGRIQTRDVLESRLYAWGDEVASNALEVHIHHLRKKIGLTAIRTIRGVGYLMPPA